MSLTHYNGHMVWATPQWKCSSPSLSLMDGLQVREIEEVHISDLSVELFEERYAYTHRPLVVRNASISWDAQQVALNKACSIFMRTPRPWKYLSVSSILHWISCIWSITLLSNKVIDYNWFKAEYMKNPKQMDKEGDECWFNRWKIDLGKVDVND